MSLRLNVVVAACSNRGIGLNGSLPWRISGDMSFFKRITSETKSSNKQNAVIMGRKTWDSIPSKFRPLPNRINVVISTTLGSAGDNVYVVRSFDEAVQLLSRAEFNQKMEQAFVIGGSSVYKEAFQSGLCHRIYLTEVLKDFHCDTFLPEFDTDAYECIREPGIEEDVLTDSASGVQYKFVIHQKKSTSSVRSFGNGENSVDRSFPLYISVAIDANRGFGLHGKLPWSIKKEFAYFTSLITEKSKPDMQVAAIMGRKTWESTLEQTLPSLMYIVISETLSLPHGNIYKVVKSFDEAVLAAKELVKSGIVEKVWALGGLQIYQDAINSGLWQKIYLTKIQATYGCDVFLPVFEDKCLKISSDTIEENGVQMLLEVYQPLSKDEDKRQRI